MLPVSAWDRAAAIGDLLPGLHYGIAYGSHAAANARPDSDLDLLFVTEEPATPEEASRVTKAVVALHHDYGLLLDTEVAFDVKLTAPRTDVAMALSLAGFATADGLSVAPVVASPAWLNGPRFRLRLILGALTGPHVFLAGDLCAYRTDLTRADSAIAVLAAEMMQDKTAVDLANVTTVLLDHPSGATGKDHLGYGAGPQLVALASRILARLRALGCLHGDESQYRLDRGRVTQQVNTVLAAYPDRVQTLLSAQKEET